MIKTILVGVAGDPADAPTLTAALSVARLFGAHIDVLHVRFDPVGAAVAMSADGGGAMAGGLIDQLEQDSRVREARAREAFDRFCGDAGLAITGAMPGRQTGPSAEWHVETGDEGRWMAAYGRTADLIVGSRSAGDAAAAARSTLEAVLLTAGRPLLITPAADMPAAPDRVAIAWKSTPQAARAVALALPLLHRAKEIAIVTVEETADEHHGTERLVRNLAWHGLVAHAERLTAGPDGAAATLLASITGRADLLVMGGYGRGQLREWIFGGFTTHVLDDAPLPVLMAH